MTSPTIDIEALKACPFCGGNASSMRSGGPGSPWQTSCTECHAGTPVAYALREFAEKAWNLRANPSAEARIAELVAQRDGLVEAAGRYLAAGDAYTESAGDRDDVAIMLEFAQAEEGLRAALSTIKAGGEE